MSIDIQNWNGGGGRQGPRKSLPVNTEEGMEGGRKGTY